MRLPEAPQTQLLERTQLPNHFIFVRRGTQLSSLSVRSDPVSIENMLPASQPDYNFQQGVRCFNHVSDKRWVTNSFQQWVQSPAESVASGGSQPRSEEGATHRARRGKNAKAFLNLAPRELPVDIPGQACAHNLRQK